MLTAHEWKLLTKIISLTVTKKISFVHAHIINFFYNRLITRKPMYNLCLLSYACLNKVGLEHLECCSELQILIYVCFFKWQESKN